MTDVALNITIDAGRATQRLGELADGLLADALARGLLAALDLGASAVTMAAQEAGIQQRTGALLRSIGFWPDPRNELAGYIGVPEESPAARYAYLLSDAVKAITPVRGEYLAIPVGAGLTPAGVPRYGSPRDVDGLVFKPGGEAPAAWAEGDIFHGLVAGVMTGQDFTPLFALVRGVTVQGFNVLEPAVQGAVPEMTAAVQREVDALLAGEL